MAGNIRESNIHTESVLVSGGGRGVSDEHKAAVASSSAAVGTCERDALVSRSDGDLTKGDIVIRSSDTEMAIDEEIHKRKKKSRKRAERKKAALDKEEEECATWFQNHSKKYVPPAPKYLLVKDIGVPRYTDANVMKRTAWLGMALGTKDRSQIPDMRRVNIKDVNYISICVEDPGSSKKLLAAKKLGPCTVEIIKDPIKNSSYGVLYDQHKDLKDMSETAIKELMSHQGVTDVMQFKNGKEQIPTKAYKITFDSIICPLDVTVDGRFYRVKEYVPPPLRCFYCQRYDHARHDCRCKEPTCQRCSAEGHESREFDKSGNIIKQCREPKKCLHCLGNHEAGNKDCRVQVGYRKVNELMVLKKISRYEAKLQVFPKDGRSRRSDAEVVVAQTQSRERREQERDEQVLSTITARVDAYLETKAQAENRALMELNAKVDRLLNSDKSTVALDTQEAKIVKSLEERFGTKLKNLEDKLTKQGESIEKLEREKEKLEKSNEDLKKKLKEEKEAKEIIMKELDTYKNKTGKKRCASDLSPNAIQTLKVKKPVIANKPTVNTKPAAANTKVTTTKKADTSTKSTPTTADTTKTKSLIPTANSPTDGGARSIGRGIQGGGGRGGRGKSGGGRGNQSLSQPEPRKSGSGDMEMDDDLYS